MGKQWQALPSNKHEIVGIAVTPISHYTENRGWAFIYAKLRCNISATMPVWVLSKSNLFLPAAAKSAEKNLKKKCPQTIFLLAGNKSKPKFSQQIEP